VGLSGCLSAAEKDPMLTDYFRSPATLEDIHASCVGPYLDDLTSAMARDGFADLTIIEHVRTVVQLARWADRRGIDLSQWDDNLLEGFQRHLARRRLGKRERALGHAAKFLVFLRLRGVISPAISVSVPKSSPILEAFALWMRRHRGVVPHTLSRYRRALDIFVAALGENPTAYDAKRIRAFVIQELGRRGRSETREAVKAIRSFLRFLVAEGRLAPGIEQCVPTVPQWRLSSLPRYLEAPDVERVVASCNLTTGHGLRDHAILLLLSRLGLRAGDIVAMTLDDIDWARGTLRVQGKSLREVLLPLPQDVGDALLAYLERGRPKSNSTRVFLTVLAPTRAFASSSAVSDIVRFALRRAGIRNPPNCGAHLLRHSAATAMLRAGSSLDTIATVLRHRSSETTAYYAKVDVAMLCKIAQPWPGDAPC
jgi:integrase/recombinase XerD